jgi:hypothetical protein
MNCIASSTTRQRLHGLRAVLFKLGFPILSLLALSTACNAPASESGTAGEQLAYRILYTIRPNPADGTINVSMQLTQSRRLLREVRFHADQRLSGIHADGELEIESGNVMWRPMKTGGTLQWTVAVAHRRNDAGYDAWLGPDWGVLRAEDIVPRASSRTLKGAQSHTRMRFELPANWSVITPYFGSGNQFDVARPARRFDQPSGWIVMGKLGVRREVIAGVRVAVAGPADHSVRRMDTLALLTWTLPELARLLPDLPARLTVISAGDPMWRGGLSAPQSLYIHAARPLISENATSTLLHEVMHTALGISARDGFDWIVEGFAEYYSLELLRRSGTISQKRFATALQDQVEWSRSADRLCQFSSTGAVTALAVTVMATIDQEIQNKTEGAASLDDLLGLIRQHEQPLDLLSLTQAFEQLAGGRSEALDIKNLPGCRSIAPGHQEN